MSRHWYDLSRLADHEIGVGALGDQGTAGTSSDDKEGLLPRGAHPTTTSASTVLSDWFLMPMGSSASSGLRGDDRRWMFRGEPPDFDSIIDRVQILDEGHQRWLNLHAETFD